MSCVCGCPWRLEEIVRSLELVIGRRESTRVSAGCWTQVLCPSSMCSWLLSHLFSPVVSLLQQGWLNYLGKLSWFYSSEFMYTYVCCQGEWKVRRCPSVTCSKNLQLSSFWGDHTPKPKGHCWFSEILEWDPKLQTGYCCGVLSVAVINTMTKSSLRGGLIWLTLACDVVCHQGSQTGTQGRNWDHRNTAYWFAFWHSLLYTAPDYLPRGDTTHIKH